MFNDAIGRDNVRKLHERGIKIKPLGYPIAENPAAFDKNRGRAKHQN